MNSACSEYVHSARRLSEIACPAIPLRVAIEHRAGNVVEEQPTWAQTAFGDLAPTLTATTDEVLFAHVWTRPQLSAKIRSLVTVAALVTNNNADQLKYHLQKARDNGASAEELIETITHLAFYAGWPQAISAMNIAEEVLRNS
jgi:4-carboxymuconolactone decarboxylase